jgi:4-amino-4-deoxy-L-arabinose transferase-like glycosyltransferase
MKAYNYKFLWTLIIVVMICGLFFPYLMGSDAPEYASIATHMYFRNDWVNIVHHSPEAGKVSDYLDKPHMLFWSAMIGFKLFGVHDWSYRLVSVLLSLAGAFATYRLGRLLYNEIVGKMAAVFFITAQAIILANHDVKTDSLLTSFVILAVWHFAEFVQRNRIMNMIWGAAFLACAVGTKGMIAVMVTGFVMFFYILGQRKWKALFNWKWIIGVVAFFVFLSPVLYCYYLQFDQHPEKLVNGSYGQSGIKFLLWTQSFERFTGNRSFVMNAEYSFFFHTFLWAFLPWSLLTYIGVFYRIKELIKTRCASFFTREQLTFTGVWVMFLIMSLSKFKLPHYLNILFPMFAVFTAGFIYQLWAEHKDKWLKALGTTQYVINLLILILMVVMNVWAFPITSWWIYAVGVLWFVYLLYVQFTTRDKLLRIWFPSAVTILLLNFILNTNFYPKIDQYQGDAALGMKMKDKPINWNNVYVYQNMFYIYDYYSRRWQPMLTDDQIRQKKQQGQEVLLLTNDDDKRKLDQSFSTEIIYDAPDYHISGLSWQFINPKTRQQSLSHYYLVRVK